MKGEGNGDIKICVSNLLQMYRGEVPYERVKGMNPQLLDQPVVTVIPEIQRDIMWLIGTYEPRADLESVLVTPTESTDNGLIITTKLKGEGELTNG